MENIGLYYINESKIKINFNNIKPWETVVQKYILNNQEELVDSPDTYRVHDYDRQIVYDFVCDSDKWIRLYPNFLNNVYMDIGNLMMVSTPDTSNYLFYKTSNDILSKTYRQEIYGTWVDDKE